MLMSLGDFIFEIGTLPYEQLVRDWSWRHATADRFGARPAAQYVGPGAERLSMAGALYPGIVGSWASIDRLREMADAGEAYVLLTGRYEVLGSFYISRIGSTAEIFMVDGVARRGDFMAELERAA